MRDDNTYQALKHSQVSDWKGTELKHGKINSPKKQNKKLRNDPNDMINSESQISGVNKTVINGLGTTSSHLEK